MQRRRGQMELQSWREDLLVDCDRQGHFYDSEELVDLVTAVHSSVRVMFKNHPSVETGVGLDTCLIPPGRCVLQRKWDAEWQLPAAVAERLASLQ